MPQPPKKKKGAVLVLVIFYSAVFAFIVGTVLRQGTVHSIINERNIAILQNNNALESLIHTGIAQLVSRWQYQTTFTNNELHANNKPLTITDAFKSLFKDTTINVNEIAIVGGVVSNGIWSYIDPDDPNNIKDPLKGMRVYIRNVEILSQIKSRMPATGEIITAQGREILQVRDAPLFSYAYFYNMDMEITPGPEMHVHGAVHTNGTLIASAKRNLYFYNQISASGAYHRGGFNDDHDLIPTETRTGDIWIKNGNGDFVNNYQGSGDRSLAINYYDSLYEDWRDFALNTWAGNFQTKEHGIPHYTILNIPSYVRDNPDTPSILDDPLNYGYTLIEPNLKADNPYYKGNLETEKFAQKSHLIIRLNETTPSETHNPNNGEYRLSDNFYVTFERIKREDNNPVTGNPQLNAYGDLIMKDVLIDQAYVQSFLSMEEYEEDANSDPIAGLYDEHLDRSMNVLNFDVAAFRKAVDDTHPNYDPDLWEDGYFPSDHYGGIVYFALPLDSSFTPRNDKIVVAKDNIALMLRNGSQVPAPSYNINAVNRDTGFTVAANGIMYVHGHFNADGDPQTGSSTEPDNPNNPNPPACLAADSITILSSNWDSSNSKKDTSSRTSAPFNEICSAFISGIVPSNKDNQDEYSGGAHNLIRMLEKWSGNTSRIRGSFVCIHESELRPITYFLKGFRGPTRDYGHYSYFASGHYPPGTPTARSFRRINFRFLTKEAYDSGIANIE